MVNIFESAKEKVVPTWAKFVEAGDSFQGVYAGKILGQIDGYGNEQIIYQLEQEDGSLINVGFGLNKKVLHADMQNVAFGQVVGFRYKGKISVKDKRGKIVEVKDFAIFQDPEIVDAEWLKAHKDNMPTVTQAEKSEAQAEYDNLDKADDDASGEIDVDDIPFSSESSQTNADKAKAHKK